MNTLTPHRGLQFPHKFEDFRREVDALMDNFVNGGELQNLGDWYNPLANVSETEKEFEITLDLPGMKPEDFNVELKHGDLWITGERKEEEEKKEKTWHRVERRCGRFQRMIHLGEEVDPENVEAEYRDGVLQIRVPKTEVSQPKKIQVKS